jgi:hypothetical protein
MKKSPLTGKLFFPLFLIFLLSSTGSFAQSTKIDWANDTISKADAIGGRDTYVNTVRGSGQLATEQIKLPVDKMKEILDACAAKQISEITVMIVTIRAADLARFRKLHPEVSATSMQIKGRQMLVFRVPRQAFYGAAGAKTEISSSNPLMISLASVGLIRMDPSIFKGFAVSGDVYFSIGTICPPPASCD